MSDLFFGHKRYDSEREKTKRKKTNKVLETL